MKKLSIILLFTGLVLTTQSCFKDLDQIPFNEVTSATVYNDLGNYKKILAKLYAGYAVSGQEGPAGQPDIAGIDEGFSSYVRQYWKAQEVTTDEAVIGWNDGNLRDFHDMDWTAGNEFITAMYNRIFYQISVCNEFIRETADEKLNSRGITDPVVKTYRAEARFLRALSYWHALDMFGNVPFVTDEDAVGTFNPKQTNRNDLFAYIEKELKAIEGDLPAPMANEYGRADKGALWTLLAKLYLNAEVYTGTAMYNEALEYSSKVIAAGYTLDPNYAHLFMADNHTSKEMIFPINFDGLRTKNYGGMTFVIHAAVGGSMDPSKFGINGGWAGTRVTKSLVNKFADPSGATDKRAMFHTDGQELEIEDIFTFSDGYAVTKFTNLTSGGVAGSDPQGDFVDTDYPMFRLADVYLMYAEAVLRGAQGGSIATAISYINQIRNRAYGNSSGNVADINLDFILDERARELYWEGHRRTDLIRFNKFTEAAYLWPWKGNVKEGRGVNDHLKLFPIPATDMASNPTLVQNPGY